jgi:O-antigen ligase
VARHPATRRRLARLRAAVARRDLRPGLWLALTYSTCLGLARLIDVSEDGKAMLLFGSTYPVLLAVAALVQPRWYPLLTVAYLPFSRAYPLPFAGVTGANLTNLLILFGLVACLVDRSRRPRRLPAGATEALILTWVLLGALSLLQTRQAGADLFDLAQTFRAWFAPIAFFFVARGLVRDRHDVSATLQVMAWTTFLVAALTWVEGLDRGTRGTIEAARVPGLMGQPNSMGAFLGYYGVPLLAIGITLRPWRRGLPYVAGFLVAARASLFTFSRGAYLTVAGGAATVLLFGNPLLLVAAGGGAAVTAVAFPQLLPDSVVERFGATTEHRILPGEDPLQTLDRSSAHRLVIWGGAARMIAERPLQGFGLDRFHQEIGHYTAVPLKEDDPTDAHNAFVLVAAEMGLPALLVLLLVLVSYGGTALVVFFRRKGMVPDRPLALACLGNLAAIFISCMLGSRFSDESLVGYFWVLVALMVVVGRLAGPRRRRS